MVKAIIFEESRDGRVLAKMHDGQGWQVTSTKLANQMAVDGHARAWPSRRMAEDYAFIPPDLKPTLRQRRSCKHEWVSIRWKPGYEKQSKAAWNYRCRVCGGYAR